MWINDILAWTTKADDFRWPHPWPLTFTVGAEGEPVFAKDHIHPLTVPTDKKCPLRLPRVTAADPQDLLEMRSSHVLIITHESAKTRMRTALNNWILYVLGWKDYLHRMANETEGGRVSRTCVFRASAVQQTVKHPSLLTGPVTGPTAEKWMGAAVEESRHQH